jgi:dTDP-4-dehydrorhamnose reductase
MKKTTLADESPKKILLIGANGFLGTNIIEKIYNSRDYKKNLSIIPADIRNDHLDSSLPFYYIDITDKKDTEKKILDLSPDVILQTAAMTNVDGCEVNKKLAHKINVEGTKNIISICKKTNTKLVFLSTDFVFDGEIETHSYSEEDMPNPLSYYGKTKYKAELAIYASGINYLICRTSVLYGWNPHTLNFITWIINKLQNQEKISIVTTQVNSPTFVKNLAEILLKLVEINISGILNTAGDCILNRYEIALKCAEIFNLNPDLINPIEKFEQKAVRPKNAGLNLEKLKNLLGNELKIFSLEEGLKYMKEDKPVSF